MHWYLEVMRKFADFSGRARRKEYWMFQAVNFLFMVVVLAIEALLFEEPMGILFFVYFCIHVVPSLAVTVRRLHDRSMSGWWILINVVPYIGGLLLLVLTVLDSEPGSNQYGPNPKHPDYDPVDAFT